MKNSLPLPDRPYRMHRMKLLFETGPFFYAEFNFRLFLFLLFKKTALLVSNDLDTLAANYLVSKIKKADLVYDSHEYFTEVPELQNNKWKKQTWKFIERHIFPKLKKVYTVNESIAAIYNKEYGVQVKTIRNFPFSSLHNTELRVKSKAELNLPENKKIILLQGAGINMDRGAEEAVEAMQFIDSAILLIIGSGDVIAKLKEMTLTLNLSEKVKFINKLPLEALSQYTSHADVGLTLDKDTCLNYRYSLPNKFFDYIHAGIPVLASPLVEIKKIMDSYHVGELIEHHQPKHIADKLNFMLTDENRIKIWKENCKIAAKDFSWELEEVELKKIYQDFIC